MLDHSDKSDSSKPARSSGVARLMQNSPFLALAGLAMKLSCATLSSTKKSGFWEKTLLLFFRFGNVF